VKVGLFWTALVPQFVSSDSGALLPPAMVLATGSMVFAWLTTYAYGAAPQLGAAAAVQRPRRQRDRRPATEAIYSRECDRRS
jgi:threonine/homoserine/homoserine lactone efflux protein